MSLWSSPSRVLLDEFSDALDRRHLHLALDLGHVDALFDLGRLGAGQGQRSSRLRVLADLRHATAAAIGRGGQRAQAGETHRRTAAAGRGQQRPHHEEDDHARDHGQNQQLGAAHQVVLVEIEQARA